MARWHAPGMTRRAWLLLLALAALWGSSYMFIKVALDGGLSPTFIVWARCLLGALILTPVALRRGAGAAIKANLAWLTFNAVIHIVGPFLLITLGEEHVSSSLAGILVASAPIWTTLIAVGAGHDDRLQGPALAGIVIGIAGVALLFGVDLGGDSAMLLGGLGILLAGLGYAIGGIVAKRKLAGVPPVGIAASTIGLAGIALLPTVPFGAPTEVPDLDVLGAMLALGLGGTGAAFLIYYVLNAEVGPSRASIVAYVAPVFSVVYGVVLLDEGFGLGTAAGLVLILGGSWLAAEGRLPRRRRQTAALAETPT